MRQAAEAADLGLGADDALAFGLGGAGGADEGNAGDGDVAGAQGFDGEQAVVDRAKRGAGGEDDGEISLPLPCGELVGVKQRVGERDERATGAFDDEGGWSGGRGRS